MKANQKFLNETDDEAVSPVIAVILMVAITVVLAATVYVWVSGFGSSSSNAAKTIALTSASPIDSSATCTAAGTHYCKSYTVASATSGMKYSDFTVTINGVTQTFASSACAPAGNAVWAACGGTTARAASDVVQAGDTIILRTDLTPSGATLRMLDTNANSIMLSLVIG